MHGVMHVAHLMQASVAAQGSAPSLRLVNAAHEFEAQMMKELLKPMTNADSLTGEDEGEDQGSGAALGEFASEALGMALSERGGFGVANSIVRDLSRTGNRSRAPGVTGIPPADTVIGAVKSLK